MEQGVSAIVPRIFQGGGGGWEVGIFKDGLGRGRRVDVSRLWTSL